MNLLWQLLLTPNVTIKHTPPDLLPQNNH